MSNALPRHLISLASLALLCAACEESAVLTLEELHPGDYALNALLDRNNNFFTTRFPDRGDGVALPDKAVSIASEGQTEASVRIVVDR